MMMNNLNNTVSVIAPDFTLLPPQETGVKRFVFETTYTKNTTSESVVTKQYIRKVAIAYLGQIKGKNFFQIFCTAIDFKGDHFQNIPFLRKISTVFDEVLVTVNNNGIIEKINNIDALQLRWKNIKNILNVDNKGGEMLHYFKTIDKLINSQQMLINFLSEHKMYGLYFNAFWNTYKFDEPYLVSRGTAKNNWKEEVTAKQPITGSNEKINLMVNSVEKIYQGMFYYQDNQIVQAEINQDELNNLYHYTLLCLGLRKS